MPLCWMCEQITPWTLKPIKFDGIRIRNLDSCNRHHSTFEDLKNSATTCELCKLIYDLLMEKKQLFQKDIQEDYAVFMADTTWPVDDLPGQAPQVCNIAVQCGEATIALLAFADPNSEAALEKAVVGRLPPEPGSKAQHKMVATWLQQCIHDHPQCRLEPGEGVMREDEASEIVELPRRVLDVGASPQANIRLVESAGMEGQYAVLSHRWPTDPSQHFTTTKNTLPERKTAIELDEMPPTFRDAVKVTRELGIRYLWIDSLCIVQDDTRDWEQQSALMGNIYYQGTITIMAATSPVATMEGKWSKSISGFLHGPVVSLPMVKLDYYNLNWKQKGNWYIQNQKRFDVLHWDLFTRGWVVQEDLLSRRKVIYTQERVGWHCKFIAMSEAERERSNKPAINPPPGQGWEEHYFVGHWLSAAEMYSQRSLTFESDRLPAFSGIARHFSRKHGQAYYAGVFSGSILETLLWRPSSPGSRSRPTKYIAPSWSWMSFGGPIKLDVLGTANVETGLDKLATRNLLEDLDFELYPEGENVYGRLTGGKMRVKGWLQSAEIHRVGDTCPRVQLHVEGKPMAVTTLDFLSDTPEPGTSIGVKCLYILIFEERLHVMILRRSRNDDEYERIGLAALDPAWYEEGVAQKGSIVIT